MTSLILVRKLESFTTSSVVGTRPLEDIFGNPVAKVLDFLIINDPFDYSLNEISQFAHIPIETLRKMIPGLVEKGLLEEIGKKRDNKSYKLSENSDLARSLSQYVLAKINYNIEREKYSRGARAKLPAPNIKRT
ncbi:MAG: hypothetical protein ACRD8Z_27270 [Nitrososphaeraceae archaeon]